MIYIIKQYYILYIYRAIILYNIAHIHSIIYGMEINNNHNYRIALVVRSTYIPTFKLNLIIIGLLARLLITRELGNNVLQ